MANDNKPKNGDDKPKRAKNTVKTEYVKTGKLFTRGVKTQYGSAKLGTQKPIAYNEVKLDASVVDVNEAAQLLGLRGAALIASLVSGVNVQAKRSAIKSAGIIEEMANAWGITVDEARAEYNKRAAARAAKAVTK